MFLHKFNRVQRRHLFTGYLAAGQLSLFFSILLNRFGAGLLPSGFPVDFLGGFFTGLSIVFNLAALVLYRQLNHSEKGF